MAVVPFRQRDPVKTVIRLDGRILRPGALVRSLGYGAGVYDMGLLEITHPDDHGISRAVYGWLLEGHSRLIVSKRYVEKRGGVVPTTVHMELVHDSQRVPRYIRSWPEDGDADWGAASAPTRVAGFADVRVVREGFVAEPIGDDPATLYSRARRVGRLVLPPELL